MNLSYGIFRNITVQTFFSVAKHSLPISDQTYKAWNDQDALLIVCLS